MVIRASNDIAFVEDKNSEGDFVNVNRREDRTPQIPAAPPWFDLLSLSFEGYRHLLLLRLRWYRGATTASRFAMTVDSALRSAVTKANR
ncbi:MAG: hypothetical protein JO106_04650 [Mycobacterium sp.]|nr:hypothetical protein [Mycobacterium sp.]